ncbi:MAG: LysM peptidoglycan-binding domain-containing protein, partial [Lachnospiraceae bacterium]|nr:LysM peptidoglycan-binding domain-containing protein [Lachnospiraceae bacterium]
TFDTQPTQDLAQEETEPAQDMVQAATPQYYVVRKGDTLRTICYDVYGDYSRVDEVCRWNNIEDPNNILYGQKLLLP